MIELINSLPDKKSRVIVALKFIEELGGALSQLRTTGIGWGAAVNQERLSLEREKIKNQIKELNQLILNHYEF